MSQYGKCSIDDLKRIDEILDKAIRIEWYDFNTLQDREEYPITWEALRPPIDDTFYPCIYFVNSYVTLLFRTKYNSPYWVYNGNNEIAKELTVLLNKLWSYENDRTKR